MSILEIFEWLDQTALAVAIHESKWAFAASETVHLLFLTALGGVVLLLNLRLLGWGLKTRTVRDVAEQLRPLFWIGLAGTVLSGLVMVVGEAMKCYVHPAFRIKMALFALSLILSVLVQRGAKSVEGDQPLKLGLKATAVINLAAWFGTAVAGRTVGFL